MIPAFTWNIYTFFGKVLYIKLRLDGPLLNAEVIYPNSDNAVERRDLICEPSGYVKDCVLYNKDCIAHNLSGDRLLQFVAGKRFLFEKKEVVIKRVYFEGTLLFIDYVNNGNVHTIPFNYFFNSQGLAHLNENTSQS